MSKCLKTIGNGVVLSSHKCVFRRSQIYVGTYEVCQTIRKVVCLVKRFIGMKQYGDVAFFPTYSVWFFGFMLFKWIYASINYSNNDVLFFFLDCISTGHVSKPQITMDNFCDEVEKKYGCPSCKNGKNNRKDTNKADFGRVSLNSVIISQDQATQETVAHSSETLDRCECENAKVLACDDSLRRPLNGTPGTGDNALHQGDIWRSNDLKRVPEGGGCNTADFYVEKHTEILSSDKSRSERSLEKINHTIPPENAIYDAYCSSFLVDATQFGVKPQNEEQVSSNRHKVEVDISISTSSLGDTSTKKDDLVIDSRDDCTHVSKETVTFQDRQLIGPGNALERISLETSPSTYSKPVSQSWNPPDLQITPDISFDLDTFQKQAFYFISMNQSVLVTAHTGSGKTAIVEYAIQLAQRNGSRVIYTSPLKALSNQKFQEFRKYSPGIITGDVSINQDSDILIMTTEILRNQLYSKKSTLDDLQYVIFDEVHYINNPSRGVVWEECIIALPAHVVLILLSAVIPNALGFAEWIGRIRRCDVYLVSNDKRVVPLEYFVYKDTQILSLYEGKSMIEDPKEVQKNCSLVTARQKSAAISVQNDLSFDIKNFDNFMSNFNIKTKPFIGNPGPSSKNQITSNDKSKFQNLSKPLNKKSNQTEQGKPFSIKVAVGTIFKYVVYKKLTPTIFFCFSKKKCLEFAKMIQRPLLSDDEQSKLSEMLKTMVYTKLTSREQSIDQIKETLSLIQCGIGVHHSGMLPLLKEMVEIMFSKKLLKVVFATETFSIGVNFPAKCVVLLGLTKRDASGTRTLTPNEFLQISGRAGRRNMDKIGIVIVCPDSYTEKNIQQVVSNLIKGRVELTSKFKLSYNLILDLIAADLKVEDVLRLSFGENISQRKIENIFEKYTLLTDFHGKKKSNGFRVDENMCHRSANSTCHQSGQIDANSIGSNGEPPARNIKTQSAESYRNPHSLDQYATNDPYIRKKPAVSDDSDPICRNSPWVRAPVNGLHCPRCKNAREYIDLKLQLFALGPKLAVRFMKTAIQLKDLSVLTRFGDIVLVKKVDSQSAEGILLKNYALSDCISPETPEELKDIMGDSSDAHICYPLDIGSCSVDSVSGKPKTIKISDILLIYRNQEIYLDYKPDNYESMMLIKKFTNLVQRVNAMATKKCPYFHDHLTDHIEIFALERKIKEFEVLLSNESLNMYREYQKRLEVLKKYYFLSDDEVILTKGKVAQSIKSADCIIISELILNNAFDNMSFDKIAAVLTSLISTDKTVYVDDTSILPEIEIFWQKRLHEIYQILDYSVKMDESCLCGDFIFTFHSNYVDPVYEWCLGSGLVEITNRFKMELGGFFRIMSMLDEVCKEIMEVCHIIGDQTLFDKVDEGRLHFKKDIMQFKSLYYEDKDS